MVTIVRNIRDIEPYDRESLERVLGQPLSDNQQLVIRIVDLPSHSPRTPELAADCANDARGLPKWCNVYAGLSDEEIAELEKSILVRADLSRSSV